MSDVPRSDIVPTDADLVAERAREERSERWLLARQVAIVLAIVALLVTHALVGASA